MNNGYNSKQRSITIAKGLQKEIRGPTTTAIKVEGKVDSGLRGSRKRLGGASASQSRRFHTLSSLYPALGISRFINCFQNIGRILHQPRQRD